jgi:metal-responsive CopG/Arc/MetJ family transcriptional regulator
LNITLKQDLLDELSRVVGPRKRSRFIQAAVARSLKDLRNQELAREYRDASAEMRRIDSELEGVTADGLD